MRTLNRNKSPFWYLLYDRKAPAKDEYGNETGEELVVYKPAVAMNANISAATGSAQVEQFGNFAGYDKVIVTDDLSCPIDENTVLFIDKEPQYDKDGKPLYDYMVKRVAKSLNSISYAVSKVTVCRSYSPVFPASWNLCGAWATICRRHDWSRPL